MRVSVNYCENILHNNSIKVQTPPHLNVARKYIGVKERSENRSPNIDKWNTFCKVALGSPWCAAFVSFCLYQAGVSYPKIISAWAGKFKTGRAISAGRIARGRYKLQGGEIVLWNKGKNRIGHIGFVDSIVSNTCFYTIEGNTSRGDGGSQADGDGVYRKLRKIQFQAWFRISYFTPVEY